jgi:hypothetical protein
MHYKPTTFAGETIKYRFPYTMPGELVVVAGSQDIAFRSGTFTHAVDMPFEIWEVSLQASQSVSDDPFIPVAAPAPGIDKFWRVRVEDTSKDRTMTKQAQLVATIKKTNENIWTWWVPYTLVKSEFLEVSVTNLLPTNFLRAEVSFHGYLIVLEPPSETR